MAIEVTAATLVDVIEIGFLFYAAYRDDTPPFSLTHTLKHRDGSYKI